MHHGNYDLKSKLFANNTGGKTCFEWVPALLCFPLPAQGQWFKGCNAVKLLLNVQKVAPAALWKTPIPLLSSARSVLVPAFMLPPRFGAFLLPRSCQMPEAFPETTWGIRVLGYEKALLRCLQILQAWLIKVVIELLKPLSMIKGSCHEPIPSKRE